MNINFLVFVLNKKPTPSPKTSTYTVNIYRATKKNHLPECTKNKTIHVIYH